MGKIRFYVSMSLAASLASAHGAPPAERSGVYPPDLGAQRRGEIREVTMQARVGGIGGPPASGNSVTPPPPPSYQLTPKGRAELREQLRRERSEKPGDRP